MTMLEPNRISWTRELMWAEHDRRRRSYTLLGAFLCGLAIGLVGVNAYEAVAQGHKATSQHDPRSQRPCVDPMTFCLLR